MRECLKEGTRIYKGKGSKEYYTIIETIGEGVTGYSYRARRSVDNRTYILKEFYPNGYKDQLERIPSSKIVDSIEGAKRVDIYEGLTFEKGLLHNSEKFQLLSRSFKDFCNPIFNSIEENNEDGSLNPIMKRYVRVWETISNLEHFNEDASRFIGIIVFENDYTNSYDKAMFSLELVQNIEHLINIVEIVKVYHEKGYWIPDLKPSNIICEKEKASEFIKILDMDCIINVNDGDRESIAFTWPYGAPEYKKNICFEQSDMYALGVIFLNIIFQNIWEAFCSEIYGLGNFDFISHGFFYDKLEEELKKITVKDKPLTSVAIKQIRKIAGHSCVSSKSSRFKDYNEFIIELEELKNILLHKGITPNVMLDNIVTMDINGEFNTEGFNDLLIPEIEIVD